MAPPRRYQRKKVRQINKYSAIEKAFYIFCEGKQTEPNYFDGFKDEIKKNPIYKNLIHIEVKGVGAETLRVIEYAQEYVEKNRLKNAEIWCVYDKDSFPPTDFNAVSQKADALSNPEMGITYHVAWSNQCIEYWFILHFDLYTADNDRKYYRRYLNQKFASLGLGRYKKNDMEIFKILTEKGCPKLAIRRAAQRLQDCRGHTDADTKPATKVHELVQKLSIYLPDEIKHRYI